MLGNNWLSDLKTLLYTDIVRRRKVTPLLVMLSFIISFVIARLIVVLYPNSTFILNEYHIHHFYFGICALALAGWILLISNRTRLVRLSAIIYGVGLGLITDEIGLLLTCSSDAFACDYFARQSYDVAVIAILIFLNAIYDIPFFFRPIAAKIGAFLTILKK